MFLILVGLCIIIFLDKHIYIYASIIIRLLNTISRSIPIAKPLAASTSSTTTCTTHLHTPPNPTAPKTLLLPADRPDRNIWALTELETAFHALAHDEDFERVKRHFDLGSMLALWRGWLNITNVRMVKALAFTSRWKILTILGPTRSTMAKRLIAETGWSTLPLRVLLRFGLRWIIYMHGCPR